MKKKISVAAAIVLIVGFSAASALCAILASGTMRSPISKLLEIDSKIKDKYLYELDESYVEDALASAYVQVLGDEYAYYYNPEAYDEKLDDFEGVSGGLGISLVMHPKTGLPYVVAVYDGSPAEAAGLKAGDSILKVGYKSTEGLTLDETVELIGGEVGEKRTLTVSRGKREIKINTELGEYEIQSVFSRRIGDTGYIKITEFNDSTFTQFKSAVKKLKNSKGLVFDLRNNYGGTVDSCIKMLDMLLPKGVLLREMDKDGNIKEVEFSDSAKVDLPMAVLVNGNTASAAEIFAMNVRDLGGGKLVGEKTFGKGIVQTTFELTDKTAVKFTTAKIVDSSGKSYHEKGLKPDIKVKLNEKQTRNFYLLSDSEDPQIQAAIAAVQK
jgi:carboxyl-terminal processing protease